MSSFSSNIAFTRAVKAVQIERGLRATSSRRHVPQILNAEDVARTLRYARVWGHSGFDGQQVGHEHVVEDGDVIELHT